MWKILGISSISICPGPNILSQILCIFRDWTTLLDSCIVEDTAPDRHVAFTALMSPATGEDPFASFPSELETHGSSQSWRKRHLQSAFVFAQFCAAASEGFSRSCAGDALGLGVRPLGRQKPSTGIYCALSWAKPTELGIETRLSELACTTLRLGAYERDGPMTELYGPGPAVAEADAVARSSKSEAIVRGHSGVSQQDSCPRMKGSD